MIVKTEPYQAPCKSYLKITKTIFCEIRDNSLKYNYQSQEQHHIQIVPLLTNES